MSPKVADILFCKICNYKCNKQCNFSKHILTAKHKKNINRTENSPKVADMFKCEHCDYKCSKKSDWDKHIHTKKHKYILQGGQHTFVEPDTANRNEWMCDCGKIYRARNSLWYHKTKCLYQSSNLPNDNTSIVKNLMKQNEQLHKMIIIRDEEQRKEKEEQKKRDEKHKNEHKKEIQMLSAQISNISSTVTNNNNTTNNTTNNKFNLNFFLNTQCKDAMSIQSFMENLQLGCKELEHMGDVGYLTGMIDIFNNTLGNMDIYKRPLHCTDLKREVLYFKQGTDWEKDSEDKQHLKKLIKNVESKNYHNLQEWQNGHPDSRECDTRQNQHYMKIATEALGGADFNKDSIYLSKIMKHILKDVIVKPQ